jgi:EpsI family protein
MERNFLSALSLPYQGWKTSDQALSEEERDLLQPDAALVRNYQSPAGETAQLAVIAGHQKRSIHTPAYCLPGGGWQTIALHGDSLMLSGRSLPVMRAVMQDDRGRGMVATYFFTDGERVTSNLVGFQATQLLKRLHGEVPLGALVRILVPITKDEPTAARLSGQLAQATLPAVLEKIKTVRLKAQGPPAVSL